MLLASLPSPQLLIIICTADKKYKLILFRVNKMFLLKLIKEKGLKKKINVIDLKSIIKYILIFNYIRVIVSKKDLTIKEKYLFCYSY